MPSAIEIRDFTFQYPRQASRALDRVTLTIDEGEFVLITGASGSGKSTLVLSLNGLIPNSVHGRMEGEVLILGYPTHDYPVHQLARLVGLVFQNPDDQLVTLTVESEIAFGPENYGLPQAEVVARVNSALEQFDLLPLRHRYSYTLSGGQKQRVAVASAMALRPRILVLDEPTTDLDPVGKEEVYDLVKRLHDETGMTVVVVAHELDSIAPYVDRAIVIDRGHVALDGPVARIMSQAQQLRNLGIMIPQQVEIGLALREAGAALSELPITADEAAQALAAHRSLFSAHNPFRRNTASSDAQAIVEVRNLCFGYQGAAPIFRAFNLAVKRGEFVGLAGANGSGKTTLALCLMGINKPRSGEVLVAGQSVQRLSLPQVARRIGYLFQNPDHQLFNDTVLAEVEYGLIQYGVPAEERARRAEVVLHRMGLWDFRERHPHSISRGQRQRLAVATVLVMEPRVIVVDEPTVGQDWQHMLAFLEIMRELNTEGVTILMITHEMRAIAHFCRRLIVLRDGTVVVDGEVQEAFAHPDLATAGVTPPIITRATLAAGLEPVLNVAELRAWLGLPPVGEGKP
jgi:energy-coupling factor transporter ATP-binding protein EcfA2